MLKGSMKIELTDVHTGETETVLEQNMVTNALAELFRPLGLAKSPAKMLNTFAPYYQNLLGGLLLFDSVIEENPETVYAPSSANLVGCGVYGVQNNTTGTLRGGYNQIESELNMTDRYMKYVYDFTTSQANGTISCVCLTHKNGGYTSYGGRDAVFNTSCQLGIQVDDGTLQYAHPNYTGGTTSDKYSGYTVGTTELLFLIDRKTDCAYYFRIDNTEGLTIISRRAYLKTVSVLENPYNKKYYVDEAVVELPIPLRSTGYNSYCFDSYDRCLYLVSAATSTTAANATVLVTKIEYGTWRVTQYEMTNTSGVVLTTSGTRFAIVHRGYLMMKGNASPYNLYKFEIGNAANVVRFKFTGVSTLSGVFCFAVNGRIYIEGYTSSSSYWLYVANMDTDEIMKSEASRINCGSNDPCYTPVLDEPMLWYASYGSWSTIGYIAVANYLATINNLSEPVTKTADKTMKVTYIIQEQ